MTRYPLLIPDLPSAADLLPWLERIDANRQYSNFGPLNQELEARLAEWIGRLGPQAHAVTLCNGTAALELGLQALGLPAGARVLVPSLTFPATALAVLRCGLQPVLAGVDPDSWLLTPEIASRADCDAVLPVATYGMVQDTGAWDRFIADTGRPVLIDAASALGFQPVGRRAAVAFSLHATKPFGCGEGGLVAAADAGFVERVRRLGNFGFVNKQATDLGTNAKMSEYAAAVALAQLARRDHLLAQRRRIWDAYRPRLQRLPGVRLQSNPGDVPPSVLCVRLPGPAAPVAQALGDAGIECRQWYCPPLHRHPALTGCARTGDLGETDALAERLLGLPFHHHLDDAAIEAIPAALARALDTQRTTGQ